MPNGPCCMCGATNYPLSYGGPNICPTCDCGGSRPSDCYRPPEDVSPTISEQLKAIREALDILIEAVTDNKL